MKDITEVTYTIEDLKDGKLTRAAMIEDFDTIRFEAGSIVTALEHGGIDGDALIDIVHGLWRACEEMYLDIGYCYENDCFGKE